MKRRLLAVLLLAAIGVLFGTRWLAAAEPLVDNMDFVEADLRDVFRSLGLVGQYNVLLTNEVRGIVTISLRQGMTARNAIGLIARTHEYDLRWLENNKTVIIGKSATLKSNVDGTDRITRVFTLYYSTVAEILDSLKVVVDPKLMASNLRTNQITIYGSALEIANAEEIIAQMDHPMPQVDIEARMEEIVEDTMRELGMKWNADYTFGIGTGFSVVSYPEITATLNALETANKAVLLAQPNTSSLDSQEATIFIGDRYPVTTTNTVDNKVTYTTEYVEIGTKLTVKPRVNMENIVTVAVKAEVSSITKNVPTGAGERPVIRSRTTESMARLRDGQTFVLTGLIRRDETTGTTGVPLLDKIPVLSFLFKSKKTESKNTVICVFLTPHINKVTDDEKRPGSASDSPASTASPAGTVLPNQEPTPQPVGQPTTPPKASPGPAVAPPTGTEEGGPSLEELAGAAGEAGAAVPLSSPSSLVETTPGPKPTPDSTNVPTASPETIPVLFGTPFPPAPDVSPTPTPIVPAATTPPGTAVGPKLPRPEEIKHQAYHVKKGETLASIGRKFGVPWTEIAAYNKLNAKATIRPGQQLLVPIPDSHKYVVQPKETLWRVAKRYGVSLDLLIEINGLKDPEAIEVGQVIILPCPVDRIVNKQY